MDHYVCNKIDCRNYTGKGELSRCTIDCIHNVPHITNSYKPKEAPLGGSIDIFIWGGLLNLYDHGIKSFLKVVKAGLIRLLHKA